MALTAEGGQRKWKKNWTTWVAKCQEKHAGRYTYPSKERQGSTEEGWKLPIVCPEHGEFLQAPNKHAFGQGCPKCTGRGTDKLADLKAKYPDWDWSTVSLDKSKEALTLVCPEHGEFQTKYNRMMNKRDGLSPCPTCCRQIGGLISRVPESEWVSRIQAIHGDQVKLVSPAGRCQALHTFTCKEHGEFEARPLDVVGKSSGCPTCGARARFDWSQENLKATPEEFVTKARAIHGDRYDYDLATVDGNKSKVRIICKEHGEFWQKPGNHLHNEAGCPNCVGSISKAEQEITEYVESLGFATETRNRKLLGGWEIDTYVPAHKLAIEYCGLYWHGEHYKDAGYHKEKLSRADSAGITLITIFEDEWLAKRDQVEQQLRAKLGLLPSIHGRQTDVTQITWAEAKPFLDRWHLQGAGMPASACYGLTQGDKLVAVATWGKSRYEEGKLELYRFCSAGVRVVGGLGKLVAAVKAPGITLVTYADRRWGTGAGYGAVGFTQVEPTQPNYFWCRGSERHSRQKFQKHKLDKVLKSFDPTLTEVENCHRNGYWRVYDCGNSKWELVCN